MVALAMLPGRTAADVPPATRAPVASRGATGLMAPNFSLRTLDGSSVRLSDFRGRVVLLNFWAMWCTPCRVEILWLMELHQLYRGYGLEVVGVAVDNGDLDELAKFVRDRHVGYTVLLNDGAVRGAYGGLRLLPQTIFIGRDGRILQRHDGVVDKADLEVRIRRALSLPLE
jgi:peroxiredoxin